jgi:cytoskeletal protein CcmA (bactofilin family)
VANIGKAITIRGDLTGNEDMVIEGQVEGKVDLPNNQLTVGANGNVKAEIHAKGVVIVGHVIGNVFGLERVEIQATGRVEGDVTAAKLVVAEGAQINGAIQMTQKGSRTETTGSDTAGTPTAAGVRKVG